MTQQEALDILKLGYNVFLTGPPGSGKTFLLNKYIDYLKRHRKRVGVTASTGIAATHMEGVTVHSWSGLGIKEVLEQDDIQKLLKKSYLKKRFRETGVLIIDEISMLNAVQFDTLNRICQAFKGDLRPFGGMQVVCSGDLFQLPPVERERKIRLAVEANVWKAMDIKVCYLKEQHRHKDDELSRLLNYIRSNAVESARQLLFAKEFTKQFFSIVPTKLYTHNADIDAINRVELAKIEGKEFIYRMARSGPEKIAAVLVKTCLVPEKLALKKGAQVMFVKNNFERGYVNGTRGRVVGFDENNLPIVETLSGRQVVATPASWTIEEDDEVIAEIRQIPLRLAWAITVHKSQGMNLDAAEIDLSKSFVKGMGYVALSRLSSLGGLKLVGINELALWVNENALKLDKEFKQMSQQARKNLKAIPIWQKKRDQGRFLNSLPQAGMQKAGKRKEKKKTISTYEKTKTLVLEKLPLSEIAKRRGLTEDTIVGHLEKLTKRNTGLDLWYLQPPQECFEKVKAAFKQADTLHLGPVREILGEGFSYRELRLVRLAIKGSEGDVEDGFTLRPKDYRCETCGRPITHRGNCLACNISAKRKREGKDTES